MIGMGQADMSRKFFRTTFSAVVIAIMACGGIASVMMQHGAADAALAFSASTSGEQPHVQRQVQSDDQSTMTQVGEGGQTDTETLDQGTPPAPATTQPANGDVETLDQGPPPAAAPVPAAAPTAVPSYTAPAPSAAAPATAPTSYAAPAASQPMGPAIPPGFGTGNVHVSAGRFGFPVGLESCHVGAVTGRAYVGLKCGDSADAVGIAPSFQDFPFVPQASFPFEGDEAFFSNTGVFANGSIQTSGNDVIVSAGNVSNGSAANNTPGNESTNSSSGTAGTAQGTKKNKSQDQQSQASSPQTTSSQTNNSGQGNNSSQGSKKQKSSSGSTTYQTAQRPRVGHGHHKANAKSHHGSKKHQAHHSKNKHGKGKSHHKK
jgi:hypothetical protein